MADDIAYGPLDARTVHLCIDMQRLFSDDTPWRTPWMPRVLPNVVRLAERFPERTIFTRFVPPERPEDRHGTWRRYFERWRSVTGERMDPALFELVPELAALVPPALAIDKPVYSPFAGRTLPRLLTERGCDAIVVTGTETDVCVLATVLSAVDLGYRVVVATDGLCSGSDETHDGLLTLYRKRFSQQIETASVEKILSIWRV